MNKKISLLEAVSIWIWWMVGGWIFAVLWEAVMLWHSATPIAFFIAWIVALFTSYSYAKLSIAFPSEWWTVTFIDKAFWNNIYSKSLNIILWLSYLVTISLYALAFWSYSATFFPDYMQWELLKHILITLAILIPMGLNMLNAKIVAISAILATFSAINATLYWNARLWYSLAVDRKLPKALYKKIRSNLKLLLIFLFSSFSFTFF